mmetsp:Transcript_2108/g.2396  ORF Transcript_2108/g.2396 Transcript_2108/m.2396 type:complete len:112 (+) Transcript_2108:128-463(+)
MCRAKISKKFSFKVDKELKEEVKEAFPDEFDEVTKRMNELKIEDQKNITVIINYGNRYRFVPNPKKSNSSKNKSINHKWTAFVEVQEGKFKAEDLIEEVKFELHETFIIEE